MVKACIDLFPLVVVDAAAVAATFMQADADTSISPTGLKSGKL